jgi:hypothetical protein
MATNTAPTYKAPFTAPKVITKNKTLLGTDSGSAWVNTGATGNITITLPLATPPHSGPTQGLVYQFLVANAHTITVQPLTNDTIQGNAGPGVATVLTTQGTIYQIECIRPGFWEVLVWGNGGAPSAGVSQIVAGTNITITPAGGTGAVTINASGGGSSNVGASIITGWYGIAAGGATNFQNYSVLVRAIGAGIVNTCASIKFYLNITSGSLTIGGCNVRTTAIGSSTFLTSTAVTWGGSATPTLSAGRQVSDAVTVTVDGTKDIYIEFYCSNVVGNSTVTLAGNNSASTNIIPISGGYTLGNQIGGTTVWASTTSGGLAVDQIIKAS